MTKRSYIRIVSYIGFLLAIIIATAIISTTSMQSYKMELEASYQQSLTELGECLDNINTDLTKSLYSNSYGEIYDLSRDLYAQCSTAKNAMSRLPVKQMELNNAYKFLSQASDYAQYIGKKAESGKTISEEEHNNLRKLLGYAEKFNDATSDMVSVIENGGMITKSEVKLDREINTSSLSNNFSQSSNTFKDFPTLLYDGPFSDQVLNKRSKLVHASKVYTKDQCLAIASYALGVKKAKTTYETDDQSTLPCFVFRYGKSTVSVTKQGGFVKEILYSGNIANSRISEDQACRYATKYLEKIGYSDMKENYYTVNDNICTINCVYEKDGVTYYGDIIKVGVSMEDGDIVELDSKTFLTNHIKRSKKKAKISEKEARKRVSKYLDIKKAKMAVIPKESGNEVACYEFTCTSKDTGEEALVYINIENGREEDIMLLLKTDNGTLVK